MSHRISSSTLQRDRDTLYIPPPSRKTPQFSSTVTPSSSDPVKWTKSHHSYYIFLSASSLREGSPSLTSSISPHPGPQTSSQPSLQGPQQVPDYVWMA